MSMRNVLELLTMFGVDVYWLLAYVLFYVVWMGWVLWRFRVWGEVRWPLDLFEDEIKEDGGFRLSFMPVVLMLSFSIGLLGVVIIYLVRFGTWLDTVMPADPVIIRRGVKSGTTK